MGDAYIQYNVSLWRRYHVAIRSVLFGLACALVLAFDGARNVFNDVFAGVIALGSVALLVVSLATAHPPVFVRLSSRGVEQRFAGRESIFTPWRDVAAVEVGFRGSARREVRFPALALKSGRTIRLVALLAAAPDVPPVGGFFRGLQRDPRFQEKISEMRRLLAESQDLEWSEPPSA